MTWRDGAALAFFLAIAVLAWFVQPIAFAGATAVIVIALANRQFNSRARFVTVTSTARLQGKS